MLTTQTNYGKQLEETKALMTLQIEKLINNNSLPLQGQINEKNEQIRES